MDPKHDGLEMIGRGLSGINYGDVFLVSMFKFLVVYLSSFEPTGFTL